jgi:hypothetical protein
MKTPLILINAALAITFAACNSKTNTEASADSATTETTPVVATASVVPGSYTDLASGKTVYIVTDPTTGYAIDSISKVPVEFYINTATNDTLYQTGEVVNHDLVQANGKWTLSPDAKVKINGDKMKIKDGDEKIKVDGEDTKIKDANSKTKVEDGEVKTKDR